MNLVKVEVQIDLEKMEEIQALNAFLEILGGHSRGVITGPASKPAAPATTAKPATAPKPAAPAKPAATEEATAEETTVQAEAETDSDISEETVREKLSAKVKDHKEDIRNKMLSLGASNVSGLDKKHYAAFVEFLDSLS